MSIAQRIKPKRKPKAKRPTPYVVLKKLIDPETGAIVKGFVAYGKVDREILAAANYHVGDRLKAEFSKPRNYGFHCLVHQLGTAVKENVEGFENCANAHEVIKRLQRESGLFCEEDEIDVPGIGRLTLKRAQSIAFDQMDEEPFRQLWDGLCKFIVQRYWPGLNSDAIAQMVSLMPEAA